MLPTSASVANTLPLFTELDWDFAKNTYKYTLSGKHIVVSGNEALKIWIRKALMVERYRYRAYFDDYGAELEQFIGRVPNDGVEKEKLFTYIQDALVVNPYITAVTSISAQQNNKKITLSIAVSTIYGRTTVGIEV